MILLILSILSSANFSGTWQTTYGDMVLEQNGNAVSGWYSYGTMSTIEGTVASDGKLNFTYDEGDVTGNGWFLLTGENSFAGEWRPDGTTQYSAWDGERTTGEPRTWVLILEYEWQESLTENEYSFGAMLDAWLGRLPDIQIRHRFVHNLSDVAHYAREASALPGEVYLIIASHGTTEGIQLDTTVSAKEFAEAISVISNLQLVHFSCCEIMAGRTDEAILSIRSNWNENFAVSGYTTSVDWGGSAIIEFYYLNQILENGLTPLEASRALLRDIEFAGSTSTPYMDAAGFEIRTR